MTIEKAPVVLPQLFEILHTETQIDLIDWHMVTCYAEKWKMSVADALLELSYVDETTLAKALASSFHLPYIPGDQLHYDFSQVSLENFNDMMSVIAIPLEDARLAISNPYDDHRGYLEKKFCEREMVVSERSAIIEALRKQGIEEQGELNG